MEIMTERGVGKTVFANLEAVSLITMYRESGNCESGDG